MRKDVIAKNTPFLVSLSISYLQLASYSMLIQTMLYKDNYLDKISHTTIGMENSGCSKAKEESTLEIAR
jgi:hypothetical protein